jgi:hypothetical protein
MIRNETLEPSTAEVPRVNLVQYSRLRERMLLSESDFNKVLGLIVNLDIMVRVCSDWQMCNLQCWKWSSPQWILTSESGGLPQWSPHSCIILFHGSRGSYLIASMSRIWHLSQNLDQNEDLFPGVHERWPVVDSKEDVGRFQIWIVGKFLQPHQLWELCLLLTSTSMRASIQVFSFPSANP